MDGEVYIPVIALGGLLLLLGAVWKMLWPFMRLVVHLNEAMPVLLSVGEQFQANGGSTLKDQMNRIEVFMADRVRHNSDMQAKLDVLYDYTHERVHTFGGRLQVTEGRVDLIERRMNRVEHHAFGAGFTAPEFMEPRTEAQGGLPSE